MNSFRVVPFLGAALLGATLFVGVADLGARALSAQGNSQAAAKPARKGIPRTADGKPDFNGIYEWPKPLAGDEICHCSATIFDRKHFAALKPGGEASLNRALAMRATMNRAISACRPAFPRECCPPTPCSSHRPGITW
jgi:hypothetical protein